MTSLQGLFTDQVQVSGDLAWLPPTPIDPTVELVSREDMFKLIGGAVTAGAPAPEKVEFHAHRTELEIRMSDGDRTGVVIFATMLGLPLPRETNFVVHHGHMPRARIFGSSSVRVNREDRDDDEPATPRLVGGWHVSVNAYVDADEARAVGVAAVAPRVASVRS